MNDYSFTPEADADFYGIWEYGMARWGSARADSYADAICDACYDLANGAKQGRPVAETAKAGYLKYRVGSHFVIYRRHDEGISVIRVLHTSMDIERHMD